MGEIQALAELRRVVHSQTIKEVRGGGASTELGSEVLSGLGRTSPQLLNARRRAGARGVERLCEVLERFESFDDLRREGLKVLEDPFWERRDQLELSVQILEASSILGIQVRCGSGHHAVSVA